MQPKPIDAFIQATHDENINALLDCFTESAVIADEGREFRGPEQIKGWSDTHYIGARVRLDILDVRHTGHEVVLNCKVDGNFPGGPFQFAFYFTLMDDKIASLAIKEN